MGCFGPDAPKPRDYAAETRDTLNAQLELAPKWLEAEKSMRPQYAELDLSIAEQSLPRLMEMYRQAQPTLADMESATQRAKVSNELGLLQQYGQDATRAIRQASGNDTLLGMLTADAERSLNGGVDPYLMEQAAQQMRAAQAGRGMMTSGAPAATAEALFGVDRANAIRNQNRAFAGQVVGLNQAAGGDPLLALLGRPSQTLGMAPGAVQGAGQYNPGNVFNPESAYAGNLYAANQAYDWQYKQATPSTLGTIGAISDMAGSFLGSVGKGFMCWVAREVYGEGDPRWLEFRKWLHFQAPFWFFRLYQDHGQRFALWVADKPRLKRVIRWWMDSRIRSLKRYLRTTTAW